MQFGVRGNPRRYDNFDYDNDNDNDDNDAKRTSPGGYVMPLRGLALAVACVNPVAEGTRRRMLPPRKM